MKATQPSPSTSSVPAPTLLLACVAAAVGACLPGSVAMQAVLTPALVACALWAGTRFVPTRAAHSGEGAADAAVQGPVQGLAEIAARTTNAIAITDAQRRVEWINPAFEQLFGYRLDDLRGRTLRDLIASAPNDAADVGRVVAAMEQGRSIRGEMNYRHRDGRILFTRVDVSPLRDAAGNVTGFMGVHEDLTRQREAERALRASEARFRLLTEAAPIMAWIEDEHGVCQWFNDQWVGFIGRDMAQDLDEGWLEHVHPDDRERCRALSRAASAARGPFEARYRLRRHDGVYRHVLDRGVPRWDEAGVFVGYVGAVIDVTQIEDQQREIAEMRNYLVDAMESIDAGVVILDAEDRIVLCNRRYQEMFDLSDSLVVPGTSYRHQLYEFYRAHPEFCNGMSAEAALEDRLKLHRHRAVWERRFGERWVQVRDRPTPSGGLVSLRVDVTAAKHTEAVLRERQEFLELAVRATNDGLWDWNLETDELYFSPRFHELLGYRPGELPTTLARWIDYLHVNDRPAIVRNVRRAARFHPGATAVEYRCLTADGSYRWFCARGMAVHDESGKARRMVGSISDIHERKLRELELVQARLLLQDAIDSVDGGLVMFDADDRLVLANERYREIYGFEAQDLLPGMYLLDITREYYSRHPEHLKGMSLDEMMALRRARHRGPDRAWEMNLGERWFQVNDRVLGDGSVISLRTDITALKTATAELDERRELLEIVVHASNDGLWDWHVKRGVLYTSPRLKELFGYRDDEIDSDWARWRAMVHPEDGGRFDAVVASLVEQGGEVQFEYRARHRSGEWRWYRTRAMGIRDADGATRRVAGSTSDISEQKRREQESAAVRQLLNEAIEAMDAGIVRFDADDRLVFCNERYRELYGMPRHLSQPGTLFRDILTDFFTRHPEIRGERSVAQIVEQRLRQHRMLDRAWEQKLGERWMLVSDQMTADGGVVSLRTDITSFKRIEADLSDAKARAEAASIAKTQFLANVSHELRTPLNGVIGMLQMLDDPAVPSPFADYVALALRSGRALLELINDLLDGAKIEAGKLQLEHVEFTLLTVLNDAHAAVTAPANAKGLTLAVEIDATCPARVCGDPTRLRQVLINLLGNAVKFTHSGKVTLRATASDDRLRLAVEDTGIGIPADMQALIFEPFTQAEESTTRRFGGTGLGLSICRSLVQLMGGSLRVDSAPGEGSRFSFDIPLEAVGEEGGRALETRPAAHGTAPAGEVLRVLVVDDVEINLQVVSALLRRLGAEAVVTTGGRQALALARTTRFDLVFMDCQMPELDGCAATRIMLAELGDDCPVIVAMTANAGDEDRRRAAAAGMSDYLTKPVELDRLAAVLRRWGRRRPDTPKLAPLQRGTLDELRETLGAEACAELVTAFVDTVQTRLDDLDSALRSKDWQAMRSLAHALTGVSLNLGAERLAALARALEETCMAGDAPDAGAVERMRVALAEIRADLAATLVAA